MHHAKKLLNCPLTLPLLIKLRRKNKLPPPRRDLLQLRIRTRRHSQQNLHRHIIGQGRNQIRLTHRNILAAHHSNSMASTTQKLDRFKIAHSRFRFRSFPVILRDSKLFEMTLDRLKTWNLTAQRRKRR